MFAESPARNAALRLPRRKGVDPEEAKHHQDHVEAGLIHDRNLQVGAHAGTRVANPTLSGCHQLALSQGSDSEAAASGVSIDDQSRFPVLLTRLHEKEAIALNSPRWLKPSQREAITVGDLHAARHGSKECSIPHRAHFDPRLGSNDAHRGDKQGTARDSRNVNGPEDGRPQGFQRYGQRQVANGCQELIREDRQQEDVRHATRHWLWEFKLHWLRLVDRVVARRYPNLLCWRSNLLSSFNGLGLAIRRICLHIEPPH
mmetsp:Transcript_5984/g.13344  ORF Transcript_5984/g.13344 Transcript_5984/m.13344 type:complete len:258 (+) Transcript_5984:127-900(+)